MLEKYVTKISKQIYKGLIYIQNIICKSCIIIWLVPVSTVCLIPMYQLCTMCLVSISTVCLIQISVQRFHLLADMWTMEDSEEF